MWRSSGGGRGVAVGTRCGNRPECSRVTRCVQALVRQYANGFSNLLSYLEQAVPTGDVWGGKGRATDEYRATLDGHAQDLKPLDHSFTAFAEGKTSLSPFSDVFFTFSRCVLYRIGHPASFIGFFFCFCFCVLFFFS